MRTILRSLCALLLCASLCLAQTKAAQQSASTSQRSTAAEQAASPSAAKLPVRRVVLYKNGVGYFEHLGRVRGRQDVHIEGLTDPIKPGERRILSYATDLGLLVEARGQTEPQRVTRVRIARGIMTHVNELHERKIYTVHSQDAEPRALIIEHPARNEWTLVAGAPNPEERAPGVYRFRVVVAPKATATLSVEEVKPLETSFQVSNLDSDQIAVFLKQGKINTEIEQALREIIAQKGVVAKLEEGMEARQKDIDRIVEDQERLRENLKALRGSAEEKALVQRYTQQLDRQETELEGLRKKIQDLEVRRDAENGRLARMIEDLAMEATL